MRTSQKLPDDGLPTFLCKHGIHEGLYNHLSSDIGRRHIAKGWEKAGIAQLLDESFSLPPEDPFEEIEGSIEIS